ncbi:DUF1674 domain-containing protein [Gluconacetobacter takamatsuzukensis]|uniref:DUF1674 domain-containing protein n=1 Tax=Gluconacetobacter takamatsuzukensis TaxID=1286190 RepID=A0A7W4KDY0_9PROT|nr:succinate dehydrogenase assembly factor 4 [Gluconacetobacter takamatsuzukensis]MBB2205116.1 DUF1674 domain-containing protein [Gluconacetobacter takamatsuzukensis]
MTSTDTHDDAPSPATPAADAPETTSDAKEYGGPKEKKPTRYGDWTVKGRCIDF